MTNPTGAVLSEPDDRDWLFHESKLAGFRPLYGDGSIDWRALHTFRVQSLQSCVAWDLCQKVQLCSMLHDATPIAFPSPLFVYQRAVRLGRADRMFVDGGSQCRYALKAARDSGLVSNDAWPEQADETWPSLEAKAAAVPPADLFADGVLATIEAFYRIPDAHVCRRKGLPLPSEQIEESMRRGYPVGCVMEVNAGFGEIGAKTWTGPIDDGSPSGYHAQTIIVRDKPGRRFGLASTWGAHLGDEGVFWLSDDALNAWCAEFWVVQHAPGDL